MTFSSKVMSMFLTDISDILSADLTATLISPHFLNVILCAVPILNLDLFTSKKLRYAERVDLKSKFSITVNKVELTTDTEPKESS